MTSNSNKSSGGVEIDIMAWLPKEWDEGMSAGCLKYVLPFEKAKEKVLQLLEGVARGEVEHFAVSLYEGALQKKRATKPNFFSR